MAGGSLAYDTTQADAGARRVQENGRKANSLDTAITTLDTHDIELPIDLRAKQLPQGAADHEHRFQLGSLIGWGELLIPVQKLAPVSPNASGQGQGSTYRGPLGVLPEPADLGLTLGKARPGKSRWRRR